ncbi:MAG: cytochrome c biogenesis protein CcdA [Gemmatimonadaceae bacterium]|nr:cytochrome c biogenesis protein CcdA [Gemmatimonadaceae bacterium]
MTPSFFWLAAITGALSLLTPCVFPMIPITVAYFNKRSDRGNAHVLTHALLFAIGIVATFTALGLGLAVVVGAAGLARFAADPWVNIAIGVAFVAFALSLLGVYDLPLPFSNRFVNRVDASARNRSGHAAGSVLMGFAFTLASFTCTAPFVGPLLVSAARGDWVRPLAGMVVFSSVFAAPFFLLALVPRWAAALPRAGVWLKDIKVIVGLFEIAAALKFFSNADLVWGTGLIPRQSALLAWVALAIIAAGYLAYAASRSGNTRTIARWIAPAAAAGVAVWLIMGLRGRSLGEVEAFLPPDDIAASARLASVGADGRPIELQWILNDHRKALETASGTGRLVLIDFTGYTCTNCRWMEANMFARPEVAASMSRYVLSRLYTDGEGELYENQQKFQEDRFGTVALPLYAIVDSRGRTVRTFSGLTRNPAEFLAFLRDAS